MNEHGKNQCTPYVELSESVRTEQSQCQRFDSLRLIDVACPCVSSNNPARRLWGQIGDRGNLRL